MEIKRCPNCMNKNKQIRKLKAEIVKFKKEREERIIFLAKRAVAMIRISRYIDKELKELK